MSRPIESFNVDTIREFLLERRWLSDISRVTFLAAGEYNENYLIEGQDGATVFRINHGSQLGRADQIEYEFAALKSVESSGCTPLPLHVAPGEGGHPGVLLMEYIDGRPFDYHRDDGGAAAVFARIHGVPTAMRDSRLLVQENPAAAIVEESMGLLSRYVDHPLRRQHAMLTAYADTVRQSIGEFAVRYSDEPLCLVNTEVNSGNFIVTDEGVKLVDWEKAVISKRYQDLGHFLVPTTTLWKSEFRYDDANRSRFLSRYLREAGLELPLDELSERTHMMERVILLRALSWCYMAFYEYTQTERSISNQDTFQRIRHYLDELEWFLK